MIDNRFYLHYNWRFGKPAPRDCRSAFGCNFTPEPCALKVDRVVFWAVMLSVALAWVVTGVLT